MGYVDVLYLGVLVCVCCIGYIGEYGYELLLLWELVGVVFDVLLVVVLVVGGEFVGFGVCDILCIEMGYLLYGYEFLLDILLLQV